jgi:hypothetical protein
MRKILVLATLLVAAGLLNGAPAQVETGCGCFKLGAPSTCTAAIGECMNKVGGLCLAPCDDKARIAMSKSKKKKM